MPLNPKAPSWNPQGNVVEPPKPRKILTSERRRALVRLSLFQKYERDRIEQAKQELGQLTPEFERFRKGTNFLGEWVRGRMGSGQMKPRLYDLLKERDEVWDGVFDLIADEKVSAARVFAGYKWLKSKYWRTTGGVWRTNEKGEKEFVCESSEMPDTEDRSSAGSDEERKRTLKGSGTGDAGTKKGSTTYPSGERSLGWHTGESVNPPSVRSSIVQTTTMPRKPTFRATTGAGNSFRSTKVSLASYIVPSQKQARSSRRGGGGKGK
jgi:hypothetical protein